MSTVDNTVAGTQSFLKTLGFYTGSIDGIWGPVSASALSKLIESNKDDTRPYGVKVVPWGKKFTEDETDKLSSVIVGLGLPKFMIVDFMGCIAWETGETLSPSVRNPGSSATGLLQFMDAVAKELGTTTAKLARMTVIEQLDYVAAYFKPYARKIRNLGDLYMAILWPKAIGLSDDAVIWTKAGDPRQYAANAGLDIDRTGSIKRIECIHKVNSALVKGFLTPYGRGW